MATSRPASASHAADVLTSPALSNVIGLVGVLTPIAAWLTSRGSTKNALLVAETVDQ